MAYKINYHGYEVLCDTVADLRALVGQNGTEPPKAATQRSFTAPVDNSGDDSEATGMAELVAKLPKEQLNLLRTVATTHGTVARDRLRELVGVSDTHQFAGLLISISKFAENIGVESPLERVSVRLNGRGPRAYHYKIKDEAQTAVKEALAGIEK
ncbi:MAG: hypothetical protein WBM04_03355 [Candidatus Korobacteraceae bacterium]